MPRDFKDFIRENEKTTNQEDDKVKDYQKIIDKYKDMDQNSLMTTLFEEASKLKQQGKLDSNSLNGIKTTLAPFLNDQQKQMLNELVTAIDEQK